MLHNLEAEQSVIAAVLLDNDCLDTFTRLTRAHFYSPAHQIIYDAICYLASKNTAVDLVTLSDRLQAIGKLDTVGGNDYLTNLTDLIPSTANFKHYVAILQKDETLRRLNTVAAEISQLTTTAEDENKALQAAEKLIFDISKEREKKELTKLASELPAVMEKFDTIARDPSALRGLRTDFTALDGVTNGLQKGNLIIIGARPSVGKTSLGLNIVLNTALNAKKRAKVAVFSLEMNKIELATRAICSLGRVSLTRANRGDMSPDEWSKLWEANKKLQNANIYVDDDSSITAEEVMRKCMRLKREQGLDLVMVDYLGLMAANSVGNKNDNRQVQVADASRKMKIMAKELEVPVLLLAQLNRGIEARKGTDADPMLSDLRESGAIEQDADIVIFIHRPKTAETEEQNQTGPRSRDYEAKIIVAKNRNGPTTTFPLQYIGEWTTFINPDNWSKKGAAPMSAVPNANTNANPPSQAALPEIVPVQDSAVSDVW